MKQSKSLKFDFLISPTTPRSAFDIGRKYSDPTVMFLEDIFTNMQTYLETQQYHYLYL